MDKSQHEAFTKKVNQLIMPILQEFEVKTIIVLADPSSHTERLLSIPEEWRELVAMSHEFLKTQMNSENRPDKKRAVESVLKLNGEVAPWKRSSGFIRKRFKVFERDCFKCLYCGRAAVDGAVLQVDHIHPKSKGGIDDLENLVTSCRECNLGKRDYLLEARKEFKKTLLKTRKKQCLSKKESQEIQTVEEKAL